MFGFLSGQLTWYDQHVSDSPNNDCGVVTGRLPYTRDAGCGVFVNHLVVILQYNQHNKDTLSPPFSLSLKRGKAVLLLSGLPLWTIILLSWGIIWNFVPVANFALAC